MFTKAPFLIPNGFLRSFGYPGDRRFVALYWSPLEEASFDDGQTSAGGLADNDLYQSFLRRKDVWEWRTVGELTFGSNGEEPAHWLIVHTDTGEVYAAPVADARRIVSTQTLPDLDE